MRRRSAFIVFEAVWLLSLEAEEVAPGAATIAVVYGIAGVDGIANGVRVTSDGCLAFEGFNVSDRSGRGTRCEETKSPPEKNVDDFFHTS